MAVDYGSSFTCAAMAVDGGPAEVLEIDNSRYLPSVVCLAENGELLTGRDAVQEAGVFPRRAELHPKRALVTSAAIRLGDRTVETVELAAATLRRVTAEAVRRMGSPPDRLVLTHPAAWSAGETARLAEAAARAGLPAPLLLPEPVAAAVCYATQPGARPVPPGGNIAVYDLGGGTFDTAVLRRTPDGGFEVCGPVGGDPHFGGEDLSRALRDLVAGHVRHDNDDAEAWDRLWSDPTVTGQQLRATQLGQLGQAKESLSGRTTVMVPVHGVDSPVRLTRAEFEAAIEDALQATVEELVRTVAAAGLRPEQLAAIYLTGGSSRIPRVADLIAARTSILPTAYGDPKAVVCLGALAALRLRPEPATLPVRAAAPAGPTASTAATTSTASTAATASTASTASSRSTALMRPGRRPWWRGRSRLVAAGTVAALVIAGTVGYAVAGRGGGSDDNAGPDVVVTVTADPTADPAHERLKGMINDDLVSVSSCTTYKSDGENVTAAISCDLDPPLDKKLLVLSFSGSDAVVAYMNDHADNVKNGAGDCTTGKASKGTWPHGREACYTKDGTFWVFWSYTDERIVARIGDISAKVAADWFDDYRTKLLK
ncbi:Hsp70 family protein [Dactylosporangium sp. NPDC049525]|uniref:Hsp70 family protein n=1 Tax=Dactylosporangium sp. NPDC049525 TaxID=3154730 RepID=UPI003434C69B